MTPISTQPDEVVEKFHDDVDLIYENREIVALKINGYDRKITSPESQKVFDHLREKYELKDSNQDEVFYDSRKALDDLIQDDFAPVFTFPKEYLDEILLEGAITPHITSFQKSVKLTAGTIGLPPYNIKSGRYMAVLVNKTHKQIGLQPRYTLPISNTLLFQGVIATEKDIPLDDLIIIDPDTRHVVYPESKVKVIEQDPENNTIPDDLAQATASEIATKIPSIHFAREKFEKVFENYEPGSLVAFLERRFADEYGSQIGSIDKDSLKQHTLKVLGQFEKYFASRELPLKIDRKLFRAVLALHDIGKPRALKEGNKDLHHKYSAEMLQETLNDLKFSEQETKLAAALVSQDPIGLLLKNGNITRSAEMVLNMAKSANVNPLELIELLVILFLSDASSYTEDAGSKKNLDHLFEINKSKKTLDFSIDYLDKIYDLTDEIDRRINIRKTG